MTWWLFHHFPWSLILNSDITTATQWHTHWYFRLSGLVSCPWIFLLHQFQTRAKPFHMEIIIQFKQLTVKTLYYLLTYLTHFHQVLFGHLACLVLSLSIITHCMTQFTSRVNRFFQSLWLYSSLTKYNRSISHIPMTYCWRPSQQTEINST